MIEMKLEVVAMPVTDIDRARDFYASQLGFNVDVDTVIAEGTRFVQLTPPGSGCSIVLGTSMGELTAMSPGTQRGIHLVVNDIEAAREALVAKDVSIGAIEDVGGGVRYAWFADPDGNTLALQEMPWRTGAAF